MGEVVIPVDAVATGTHIGNPPDIGIQVSGHPLVDFVVSVGGDPSVAKLILIFDEGDIRYDADVDGDGDTEGVIYNNTSIEWAYVDIDGDGTPDYRISAVNDNARNLLSGGQEGSNIARLNGLAEIYDLGTDPPAVVGNIGGGDVYLSSNGAFPPVGEVKDILNPGVGYFTVDDDNPQTFPCFCRGVRILTADGYVPVEELCVGDRVLTQDRGARAICWIGSARLDRSRLQGNPALFPVRIRVGALGWGTPTEDLLVSQQHRILVRSVIALRMFGEREVLVPAKQLVELDGIDIVSDVDEVEYYHFLLDQHEVVFSNGAATESLYLGEQALKSIGADACAEIMAIFPEVFDPGFSPAPVRLFPPGRRARKLAERHAKNLRHLVG